MAKKLKPLQIVSDYLQHLHQIHLSQHKTPELSYRAALENMLNAIGLTLDPVVQIIGELADAGSGRPDFGFYAKKSGEFRGVAETKPPADDVPDTADGAQVARYWKQYHVVLVTNYRDFLLVHAPDASGASVEGRYTLAKTDDGFWATAPTNLAKLHAQGLTDFLSGVLTRMAPITRPSDLADDLARHAREAYRRLTSHDTQTLQPLQDAMEKALGLHFEGEDGRHFFLSSLVQTLFYGLFSGWMLWRQDLKHKPHQFDWKDASEYLALPLIGDLYEEIAAPKKLKTYDLREPLEWATASLNRVIEVEFFKRFEQDHAITLFYEPFLEAFDPELRKQLGVWYTPPEIVKYMVARIDQLLRSELLIEDGLADDSVFILDPAAGTGSYLVEVARQIHKTYLDQGHGATAANKVRKALTNRVFGFEILPAPYVVAHLQLGVLLRELGTKFSPNERAGMYLTNALTGWEPPKGAKQTLAFHFLEEEQEAAARVKRDTPILVILGNPPYNGYAGVAQEEERGLSTAYRTPKRAAPPQGQGLNDLYVRFFRMAQRRVTEVGGKGIVCLISNYSWLDGLSFTGMREAFMDEFDCVWVDCLNGDKYRTGKLTPDGKPDPSIFSTDTSPEGIQVGTAVASLVRKHDHRSVRAIGFRHFWGQAKRTELLDSLTTIDYRTYVPPLEVGLPFIPSTFDGSYMTWPRIPDLFPVSFPGVKTSRDDALVCDNRDQLTVRMRAYFDPDIPFEQIREKMPSLATSTNRFDAHSVRQQLVKRGFLEGSIVRYSYRPFDIRWVYWEPETKLLDEKRSEYFPQVTPGNLFLFTTGRTRKEQIEPAVVTDLLCDLNSMDSGARGIPLYLSVDHALFTHPGKGTDRTPNLAGPAAEAIRSIAVTPEQLFLHALATINSPLYRSENQGALRHDWPHIPIPDDATLLRSSAKLGQQIADLLLPDCSVAGVTTGKLRPELKDLAIPTRSGGGNIDEPADTRVEAGWGFFGQKNAVMCGKGMATPFPDDRDNALNIWINDRVCWSNVPTDVWKMTIGGYPVIKKWLSYREYKVLGRALTLDELYYITNVTRRLKALLLLGPQLDANYTAAAAAEQLSLPANTGRS